MSLSDIRPLVGTALEKRDPGRVLCGEIEAAVARTGPLAPLHERLWPDEEVRPEENGSKSRACGIPQSACSPSFIRVGDGTTRAGREADPLETRILSGCGSA
ncbi:MAG: hypothetical protein LBR80_13350 [Deltaproteobacteria bacterium]|jgi:hypothetical protein|nr:hypothetical protein [Deltaproteobacteria bacterium]